MTETNEQTIPETELKPETVPITPEPAAEPEAAQPETAFPEKKPITWEAAVLLALSFLAALWYWFGHNLLAGHYYGPGIGLTISHWVLTATILILAKVRNTLKPGPAGIFLLVLSLLLGAVYGIFANTYMKLLNLPVLLLLSAQTLFTLTGHNAFPSLSGQSLWEGFRRYFTSLFRCWAVPFRALSWKRSHREEGKIKTEQVFFGIFAAFGAGILAMVILSSADEMFAGMISSVVEQLENIDGPFVARLLLSFPLAMLLFSHRTSLLQFPAEIHPIQPKAKNSVPFRMVLTALSIVYGLFAYIQVRYLFMGTESVQMSGGYAAYARSGFFQLVLVAILTLCLILPVLILCKKDKPIKILCALVAVLTIIIDISAFFRMRLYIDAYGLTTLRIITLWGIAMILLALLASIIKVFLPDIKMCPVLATVILTTWIGLNYINIDHMVANNLVTRYNTPIATEARQSMTRQELENCIADIFSDQYWSPDYYPSLDKLENSLDQTIALKILKARGNNKKNDRILRNPPLYDWSLSFLKVPKD